MPIRTIKLEIWPDKERRKAWAMLADECRIAVNLVWETWRNWHAKNESRRKLREWLALPVKDRPKFPVVCFPPELSREIYAACCREHPTLASRTSVLLQNITRQRIQSAPGQNKLKGWVSILLLRDPVCFTRGLGPIPFDPPNSKIVTGDDGKLYLETRIERVPGEPGKNGTTIVDRSLLVTWGKIAGYAKPAYAMAAGEVKWKGSQVFYDRQRKKWFAALTYDAPSVAADVNPDKVFRVWPGRKTPWLATIDGKRRKYSGRWRHVAHRRTRLLEERFGRAENYKWAGKNAKGHGRDRGIKDFTKMTHAWLNFCKTVNQQFAAKVVADAIAAGCGTIEYHQPRPALLPRRLETMGKIARTESTGWPWYQVGQLLKNCGERHGIAVKVVDFPRANTEEIEAA